MLSTREWYYTYGLNHTIGTLLVGATVVFTRDQITNYLQAIHDYKIVDINTREPLGPNERGEICFRTPSLMPGYLGDISHDHLDEEGFFKSGDIGYYDEDRYFYVTHRIKDITVSPSEIEAVLLQYPGVKEACVVAIDHRQHGEVPAAVVIADDVTEDDLLTFVAEQLTSLSIEGGIRFVDHLPKVAGVKFDRKAIKDLLNV